MLRSELAGTVVHLVNPFEPYEGYIGEDTPEYHNQYVSENWLAFRLDEHNRYHFLADEGYFLRSEMYEAFDQETAQHFAQSLARYQATQAHFQATGKLQAPDYTEPDNFLDQLGGGSWFGNWTSSPKLPAAYEMHLKKDVSEDDSDGEVFIYHHGKPFFQVAGVSAYNYGCYGADWVILFYEPESRIALITFDWT